MRRIAVLSCVVGSVRLCKKTPLPGRLPQSTEGPYHGLRSRRAHGLFPSQVREGPCTAVRLNRGPAAIDVAALQTRRKSPPDPGVVLAQALRGVGLPPV